MGILLNLVSAVVALAFAALCLFINSQILSAILLDKTSMWATLLVLPILALTIGSVASAFDDFEAILKRFRR